MLLSSSLTYGDFLSFVDSASLYNLVNKANLLHNLFLEYLFTSLHVSGRVERTPPCIPDSHPHRVTSTKCCINSVVSPDDGHIVARNMYRKEINIRRKIVHQVGFIYRI